MAVSNAAELALLISVGSAAMSIAVRGLLLLVAGFASIYAKEPVRRTAAANLTRLIVTLPWQRQTSGDPAPPSG